MTSDPYEVLGVEKTASATELEKAYRRLAKTLHPDFNPGNKTAEAKFNEISSAYNLLNDPVKRARFDRGEIDAQGTEKPRRRTSRRTNGGPNYADNAEFCGFGEFDTEDILSELFGATRGGRARRGGNVHYELTVDFLDAVNGGKRTLITPDDTSVDVIIPAGIRDGQVLRLHGKGNAGTHGAGDAIIEVHVAPHPFFQRDGNDIRLELPISFKEAVLGGKIKVPTPGGPVTVTLPKWANTGRVLRLKGKGVPGSGAIRGDAYITLRIVLPEKPDPALEKFAVAWHPGNPDNPRKKMCLEDPLRS